MHSRTRLPRLAPLAALALVATACGEAADPFAPTMAFNAVAPASVGEGELWICKAGNGTGVFGFSWAVTLRTGEPVSSGTASVAVGQCVMATSFDPQVLGRYLATVTETTLPPDWSLTSIGVAYSLPTLPSNWPVPVIDLPGRTASNVGMANDVGATITFTNTYTPPPPPFCTLTQGYWKTHPADWDQAGENYVTTGQTFYNSGKTYLQILWMPPAGGNAYLQLAHQFIAASLNVKGTSGSGNAAVDAALAGAHAYFAGAAAGIPNPSGALRSTLNGWAGTLDKFNNGLIGPGHCDD